MLTVTNALSYVLFLVQLYIVQVCILANTYHHVGGGIPGEYADQPGIVKDQQNAILRIT